MIPPHLKMASAPLWVDAVAVYPWDAMLARLYTVPSRFEDQEPMRLWRKMTRGGQDYIGLPRQCCPPAADDRTVAGSPAIVPAEIKPRTPEQGRVMDQTIARLANGESFVLQCPTGFGKTVIALKAIAAHGRTALIVVPKEDLMDQWTERALQFTGLARGDIGRIKQDVVDVAGRPIVLGSLQSLAKPDKYPEWVLKAFGLIVFDECHRLGADLLGQVACLFPARQRLGLSATPARKDGKDLMLHAHIGPVAVVGKQMALTPKVLAVHTGWKVPRNSADEQIPHAPGRIALVLNAMMKSMKRNRLIATLVRMAYEKGRRIVVFSAHIEHLETIKDCLAMQKIPASDVGRYYGTTTKAQLAHAAGKRVILATYSKMSEGTDIPALDTAVLASPMSNVTQAVGRILREHPDKRSPVVFDLVDDDSPVLAGYYRGRQRAYRDINAEFGEYETPAH